MPILISDVKTDINSKPDEAVEKALKKLGKLRFGIVKNEIYKTSLDARKQNDIHFVHTVYAELDNIEHEKEISKKLSFVKYIDNSKPAPEISKVKKRGRVVVTGFGPAGMFCGLLLAEYGYKPVILERGDKIENRERIVNSFWNGGNLDDNSNVQFGEGGAGTFSDGKLTTRIKDPLCRYVLERFCEFGAPEEILFKAKPHVGTDKLRTIVKNIRERIISLGGEIRFLTKLEDFKIENSNIKSIIAGGEEIEVSAVVLAVGHSARDTFELLFEKGVFLEPKPFAVGARIEHRQTDVDESLYGKNAGNPLLPKGEYQLSFRDKSGRGCYTFCMCPGGVVVPSSSEKGGIVTNGMSEFARDKENANAAVVVSVTPDDFGKNPLDGMYFARRIERNAFKKTGSYAAPAIKSGDFISTASSSKISVCPTYSLGVSYCGFEDVLPEFVISTMQAGLYDFGRKMKCFKYPDAVLTAPETRTSSPVRITRNEKGTSLSLDNLYPCGEGAGYAGGITSSAVDGLKTAIKIIEAFSSDT